MKSINCVLLLSVVSNGLGKNPLSNILNRMAENNKSINGIFDPSKEGVLDENGVTYFYKGLFLPKRIEVAMQFKESFWDGHEYQMYTYLNAINNPKVEAYGIATIYYYGSWNDYEIMAMTLLDRDFYESKCDKNFNEMDLLILFREFVRITKYIHVSGVFHYIIKIEDIWFRKHQGFIYDFAGAHLPSNTRQSRLSAARRDWKNFLSSMYLFIKYSRTRWSWLGFSDNNSYYIDRMENITNFASSLIDDAQSNEVQNFSGLRKVIVEFAKHAYCNDITPSTIPFYDQMYRVIIEELEKYARQLEQPAIPSWLTDDQDKLDAISAINEIPNISIIRDPFESEEIEYDKVKFKFFRKLYHSQPSSSGASEGPDPGKKSSNHFDD